MTRRIWLGSIVLEVFDVVVMKTASTGGVPFCRSTNPPHCHAKPTTHHQQTLGN